MKTRNGFVSNSSSTSFVVPSICKGEAEAFGLELISIGKIKSLMKQINEAGGGWLIEYDYKIQEMAKMADEDFITRPFDRDRAYDLGIDYMTYQEDL